MLTKLLCALALLSSAAFGQYSLVIPTTGSATNVSVPANSGPCTYEGDIHGFTLGAAGQITRYSTTNCGMDLAFNANLLQGYPAMQNGGSGPCVGNPITFNLAQLTGTALKFRATKDDAAKTYSLEVWDGLTGAYLTNVSPGLAPNNTCTYTAITPPTYTNGITLGDSLATVPYSSDFFRQYNVAVPVGSKMPVTTPASTANLEMEWKFDQSLMDASGNGFTAALSNIPCVANACYASSATVEALILPVPQVASTPFAGSRARPTWSNWISLKVGALNTLDCTNSLSQAYQSSVVSCVWSQTAGTTTPLSSSIANQPTLTPSAFGPLTYHLVATDMNGGMASADLALGAVAMDSHNNIVPDSSLVGQIFGPMKAFGQNPWTFVDQLNQSMVNAQITRVPTVFDTTWATLGAGTITYPWSGTGRFFYANTTGTQLASDINATTLTITVTDSTQLDLSVEPTWLFLGTDINTRLEMVRECSHSGNTLTICYDGRGMSGNVTNTGGSYSPQAATSWTAAAPTYVGQFQIKGASTKFSTDANVPICPAGVPGPPGPVIYTTGTVTFTGSSATMVGSGTTFTTGMVGGYVRVAATHGGGTSFILWRQISAFVDTTHLTLDHAVPSDIDGTAFAFKITGSSNNLFDSNAHGMILTLQALWTDGHPFNSLFNGMGCESETQMFSIVTHDTVGLDNTVVSGAVSYSYKSYLSTCTSSGTTTPFFYGLGLAGESFYHRSGAQIGLTLSNIVNPYATRDPEYADGIAGCGFPLTIGGPVIGTMACVIIGDCPNLILDSSGNKWKDVEPYALTGELGTYNCNGNDTRTNGYLTTFLTMMANWTLSGNATTFTNALKTVRDQDKICVRNVSDGYTGSEVNSFANAFVFGSFATGLTLTNGSPTMTGTGFTNWSSSTPTVAATCYGQDSVTITIGANATTATLASGSLTAQTTGAWSGVSPTQIAFYDGTNVWVFYYSFSGSTITIGGTFTGTPGTYSALTLGGGELVGGGQQIGGLNAIWTDNTDSLATNRVLEEIWPCKATNSTTATLIRNWSHATLPGTGKMSQYNIASFGQQPFMLGIKTVQMNWAGRYSSDSGIRSDYTTMMRGTSAFYNTYGQDPLYSKGTNYDTVCQLCNLTNNTQPNSTFSSISYYQGLNTNGNAAGASSVARTNSAEGGIAMTPLYALDTSSANKTAVDNLYGAIVGSTGSCDASVASTCDGTVSDRFSEDSMAAAKWPGFFFGAGGLFINSWPAVRDTNQGTTLNGSVTINGNITVQ